MAQCPSLAWDGQPSEDPHPWSEHLLELLENNGVSSDECDTLILNFDNAIADVFIAIDRQRTDAYASMYDTFRTSVA